MYIKKLNIFLHIFFNLTFFYIGQWGAAACLIVLSYCKHESTIVTLYTLGTTLLGFAYFGFNINHLDIVPKYAGFFMGITNALSNISNVLGPLFVGFIVYDAVSFIYLTST